MSQQDYTIDNATGAAVRADLNATLQAIVSANSGTSEPSTMFAYQIWADTTANKLKIRNGANNAWYDVGALDSANLGLMLASFFPNINANVTATDEEINKLDGLTATTTELNLLSGKTAIPTAADAYPIGSIYMNASNSANPASLLGFGTWVSFGAGRVLVGLDATQSEFNAIGETGGAKTHTLTTPEIPTHRHYVMKADSATGGGDFATDSPIAHARGYTQGGLTNENWEYELGKAGDAGDADAGTSSYTGSGSSHNNLQPYITVYMWKRTA